LFQIFAGFVLHTIANCKPHKLLGVGNCKVQSLSLEIRYKSKNASGALICCQTLPVLVFSLTLLVMPSPEFRRIEVFSPGCMFGLEHLTFQSQRPENIENRLQDHAKNDKKQ
jgi:hypothetical protein